jgi:uroporphyrinogen decarboxylase
MTPMQRFRAAVDGAQVDHLPATAWLHFGSDHLDGEEAARLHERFVRSYEWDVVKVMGDYRYPVPSDLRSVDGAQALDLIGGATLDTPCFAQQLRCLRQLQSSLGPDVPLLDTGFDPYQSIVRNIGRDQQGALWSHRAATLRALERVCDSICTYIQELKRIGVTGYFYSMNSCIPQGFPRGTNQEEYDTFLRPFDLRVLEAAEGLVRVLHVHGTGLDLSRLQGYPFEVINLSDRAPSNPSVAQLRSFTTRCVMGGIDEGTLPDLSLGALAQQMEDALAQAGSRRGFILAPGCAVPSYSPWRSLRFFREHSRRL